MASRLAQGHLEAGSKPLPCRFHRPHKHVSLSGTPLTSSQQPAVFHTIVHWAQS